MLRNDVLKKRLPTLLLSFGFATLTACAGTTTLHEDGFAAWLAVGDDGDFVRPATKREARAVANARRHERRKDAKEARIAAQQTRNERRRDASSSISLATRPAGPSTSAHRTPRTKGKKAKVNGGSAARGALGAGNHRWDKGMRRVQAARRFVGRTDLGRRPFVAEVLRAAGEKLSIKRKPYAGGMHRFLKAKGKLVRTAKARPGDIVLFAKTHDLNGNGRPDDGVTWAGIVEQARDGRLVFIAHRAGKVRRMAASPGRATTVRDGDDVLNTRLVRWPGTKRSLTAGECLAAIGRP